MTDAGFIGLGAMGGPMALRLLTAGHTVIGYNRTKSKAEPLIAQGMQWAGTPRAVAEATEVIFSMVTDNAALSDIAEGPGGVLAGLTPHKVWVDMSTVAPDLSRALAARVAATGAQMLDAPVSGGPQNVAQGSALIMAGGDGAAFERVQPLLEAIGRRVMYLGGNGNGLIMALATNLNLAVQMLAFCEGVLLAEKKGIPRETAVEVLVATALALAVAEQAVLAVWE